MNAPTDEPPPWVLPSATPLSPPQGTRDLLGDAVARQQAVSSRALAAFARYGYERLVTPPFEREDVLLRGVAGADARDLVRLLDPDTAEVLALRSDMTPQVARVVATRRGGFLPQRLCYEGSVLRRPQGRASRRRQFTQAGVECVGWAALDADLEVLRVTLEALRDNAIDGVVLELSHAAPLREALCLVPDGARDAVADALSRRDRVAWEQALSTDERARDTLREVCALRGEARSVLPRLRSALDALVGREAVAQIEGLASAAERLLADGLAREVLLDLGELRARDYYTGAFFQCFAEGSALPVAAGGRYDGLLARFGVDLPATGAAIDLGAVLRLGAPPVAPPALERVVVYGPRDLRREAAAAIRDAGGVAIELDTPDDDVATRFAASAGAARVLRCG